MHGLEHGKLEIHYFKVFQCVASETTLIPIPEKMLWIEFKCLCAISLLNLTQSLIEAKKHKLRYKWSTTLFLLNTEHIT